MHIVYRNYDSQVTFRTSKPGDVGHDLYTRFSTPRSYFERFVSGLLGEDVVIVWPFTAKVVGSGIKVNQPDTLWCLVTGRSSTMKKKLMCLGGIIDSGYHGELFAVLHNFGLVPRIIRKGERYVQVIFFKAVRPSFIISDPSNWVSARGDTGFGSTGK